MFNIRNVSYRPKCIVITVLLVLFAVFCSKNNSYTKKYYFKIPRRSQTAQLPRNVISRQVSREQQVSGEHSENHSRGPAHLKGPRKPHGKHRKKHGRHHSRHPKIKKQLSDIPESPSNIPTEAQALDGDGLCLPAVATDTTEGNVTSDSDTEMHELLPKLADLEPDSPRLASGFGALNEPEVSTKGTSTAGEDSETVM